MPDEISENAETPQPPTKPIDVIAAIQDAPSTQIKRKITRNNRWKKKYGNLKPTRQAKTRFILDTIYDVFTPGRVANVVEALIEKAEKGDVFAANTLFDRTLGKASQKITVESDTESQDQLVQLIINNVELARLANDLARRVAMQSGGDGSPPDQRALGMGETSGLPEPEIDGSGDGTDQEADGVDATAEREIGTDFGVVPNVVSGDVSESQSDSGELRIGVRGELGPQGEEHDPGIPEGAGEPPL